ncbi:hypothetical protein [Acinetobacter populi]|uniref:Peptidase M15 n=1 Tax=Acinetobacter populi TaxID=1582270 RepID=A0A1Z9YU09_9GAMM|nr:hypothetical protein [Acinetobacter populi]OUY05702.1 hypothetical protein CAP51_15855 [Acinetobacter populi]
MKKITSIDKLEDLGRIQLSQSFFMRDFLYSEIANWYGIQNFPDFPDIAVQNGKQLCEKLLEPLQNKFGRIAIRSAYRSPKINQLGNEKNLSCANNEKNFASHIWDYPNDRGYGATACIVIPSFLELYDKDQANWQQIAYWIHNHLPYSRLEFFPKLCAFNINWHEQPLREIYSYIQPRGYLLRSENVDPSFEKFYPDL